MRTNIDIDDELLAAAMALTGLPTKKATVEHALQLIVQESRQRQAIMDMAGLGWDDGLGTFENRRRVSENQKLDAAE